MTRRSRLASLSLAALVVFVAGTPSPRLGYAADAQKPVSAKTQAFEKALADKVTPFLDTYCNKCHNSDKSAGGVPLDIYATLADAKKDRKMWETISRVVSNGEMPPKNKPQPKSDEKAAFLTWIDDALVKLDCAADKDPGRVTLRRLNRAEYNNTVRDLCGVTFKPADDFPSDDVGYGFDNIGDVLSMPPVLMEKYLAAADKVLAETVKPVEVVASSTQVFKPQNLTSRPRGAKVTVDKKERINLTTADGFAAMEKFNFPIKGTYQLRVKAVGTSPDETAAKLVLTIDKAERGTFDAAGTPEKPAVAEFKLEVDGGERRVAVALANPSDAAKLPKDKSPRALAVFTIEVTGPLGGVERPLTPSTQLVLGGVPAKPEDARPMAEKALAAFARRAFRRPAKPAEVARLMKLYDLAVANGDKFEQAMKLPLKAILVSPNFLFRVEADPPEGTVARTLSDLELATRLSYFLWASMPDEALLSLAERGELRKGQNLESQIKRMLADKKSYALVENFAGQWLQLRNLKTLDLDLEMFKSFDESLRTAMIGETEHFFEYIVRNDRSVLEFLDADYTFLNDRLSWHYGVPNVKGNEFRYVKLADKRRGGLLTMASILTVTSNPTRTSPVKRGKWITENVLGLQPPPAAPDVPELPPVGQLKGTLRQQMEQHRANPSCAGCHAKLDPIGFGLENFDAIGGWRDQDNKIKIDASGVLPDGATFDGPAGLRQVLLGKADMFRHCIAEKLMTYGLGRGLEHADKCVLDEISLKMKAGQDKFSVVVLAIVQSDAFQKRKGKRSE